MSVNVVKFTHTSALSLSILLNTKSVILIRLLCCISFANAAAAPEEIRMTVNYITIRFVPLSHFSMTFAMFTELISSFHSRNTTLLCVVCFGRISFF